MVFYLQNCPHVSHPYLTWISYCPWRHKYPFSEWKWVQNKWHLLTGTRHCRAFGALAAVHFALNGSYLRKRHGTRAHQQASTHFPTAAQRFPLRSSAKAKEDHQSSSSSGHPLQASVRRIVRFIMGLPIYIFNKLITLWCVTVRNINCIRLKVEGTLTQFIWWKLFHFT